jgi:hypothetical protein
LADAIERGQTDQPGMRLKIEANGDHFRNIRTYKSNRELLNAGHFIRTERANGLSYVTIYALLPDKFGIVDGSDYGRRARAIYSDFMEFLESDDAYVSNMRTMFDINDDNFLAACQQKYAENISLSPIPWDDLETGSKK